MAPQGFLPTGPVYFLDFSVSSWISWSRMITSFSLRFLDADKIPPLAPEMKMYYITVLPACKIHGMLYGHKKIVFEVLFR